MLDRVRNEEIRSRLGQVAMHSVEQKQTEWARKCLWGICQENNQGERPRKRWTNDLKMI